MNRVYVVVLFVILILLALWLLGFYPEMKVNSEFVSAANVRSRIRAARTMEATIKKDDPRFSFGEDIDLQVINGVIENMLIEKELADTVEPEVLSSMMAGKMDALSGGNFTEFAKEKYGLSPKIAEEYIVLPRLREEILKSKMILGGKDFAGWLKEAKKSARVTLFSPSLRWNGEGVIRD